MSNVQDVKSKQVKITLNDGVERTLKFDLNAMAELEEKYGTVDEAFEQLEKGSFKTIRFVLWAGLMHENEELTERQVGSLIDMSSIQDLMAQLGGAFNADMPTQPQLVDGTSPNQ